MSAKPLILVILLAAALSTAPAHGQQPGRDTEWPCAQRKVPTIAPDAIWSGPDLATAGRWEDDSEAAALAQRLASRRTELDEADRLIHEFARNAGADRDVRLARVFAGALELINTERSRILHGIERYAEGQRRLADRIRETGDKISAVKDEAGAAPPEEIKELETRFTWDRRIFDERRQALAYVCETPVVLERRAFEIARRIQGR